MEILVVVFNSHEPTSIDNGIGIVNKQVLEKRIMTMITDLRLHSLMIRHNVEFITMIPQSEFYTSTTLNFNVCFKVKISSNCYYCFCRHIFDIHQMRPFITLMRNRFTSSSSLIS